jgi:hypothetical protein
VRRRSGGIDGTDAGTVVVRSRGRVSLLGRGVAVGLGWGPLQESVGTAAGRGLCKKGPEMKGAFTKPWQLYSSRLQGLLLRCLMVNTC